MALSLPSPARSFPMILGGAASGSCRIFPFRAEFITQSHFSSAAAASPRLSPRRRRLSKVSTSLGQEETELPSSSSSTATDSTEAAAVPQDASSEDLESIREVQRVLELLKKNRDMTFGEVKLTILIEDPRDIERKRLLGIEDPGDVTREDLVDALVYINEGRIPENRIALRLLAKEMAEWPDLETEASKKKSRPTKSVYAKVTDTGVDPERAAKRLNIDWDSAAYVDDVAEAEDIEVPPAVGYGALYLVTALPVLIGISVVLILFYNSLQ